MTPEVLLEAGRAALGAAAWAAAGVASATVLERALGTRMQREERVAFAIAGCLAAAAVAAFVALGWVAGARRRRKGNGMGR